MNDTLARQAVTDCDRPRITRSQGPGANGSVHHRLQPPPHHPPRRSLWWASDNLSQQPPPAPMEGEHESPPLRSTILGSLLRGRPRGTSQSVAIPADGDHDSHSPSSANRRRPAAAVAATNATAATPTGATPQSVPTLSTGISGMLRRRRSAGTLQTTPQPMAPAIVARLPTAPSTTGPTHRIRLVPAISSTRASLRFDPITRDLRDGDMALRIGRFTDRSGMGLAAANASNSNKLAFKSKVVSRAHAEIWVEDGGKFYIRDTKSSSGTFLNHVRLSPAGAESARHQLRDGDILQLGVDYQGGTEDIYKAVKIRVEIGREWQSSANAFK
jgi:E3 ubiquitin-protein ligase DMA1/2